MLICACALALKLLVPTGYMISNDHGRIAMTICSGVESQRMMVSMPGMHHGSDGEGSPMDSGKSDMPCSYASMASAALDSIDPIQLGAFLAFLLATVFHVTVFPVAPRALYLRPPLRGPPVHL